MSVVEGKDVVVNSIAEDVSGYEYELTGSLSDKVEIGIDCVCKFVQCIFPWRIVKQII